MCKSFGQYYWQQERPRNTITLCAHTSLHYRRPLEVVAWRVYLGKKPLRDDVQQVKLGWVRGVHGAHGGTAEGDDAVAMQLARLKAATR